MNQLAFTNPEQARDQFIEYLQRMQANQNWPVDLVAQLTALTLEIYNDVKSWFKSDTEETKEFWNLLSSGSASIINNFTNGNPSQIPKYNSFMAFLASASDTAFTVDQNTGLSGVANVAQEQLEEVSKDIEETRKKTTDKLPLYITLGLVAYFTLPKLLETALKK